MSRPAALAGLALATAVALSACGGATASQGGSGASRVGADGRIGVVASTDVYGSIVAAVGGAKVDVHSIITDPAADPHSYEATAQDKLAVSKAALGVANGAGYDDFFTNLAAGVLPAKDIVTVAATPGLDAAAPNFNEHLWYSLPTMATLADTLATRLSAIAPADAGTFTKNAAAFKATLGGLQSRLAVLKKKNDGGAGVAITEPVPLYLLQEAGYSNKTPEAYSKAIEDGSDVPPLVLKETTDLVKSSAVRFLAYNAQTEGPQTAEVKKAAESAGKPVLDFTETLPAGQDYLQWMDANVSSLERL
ncbi:metal ABC transporter solute-binding protein, Zn/Mn family [Specibacter cremeus]|uniref:metal ABC transporter solute-binding protein, Zn/Mn family n=1 Tax=Specibacter cremeus TaxID=1629051 RepID=UPI001F0C3D84|nr:zinc ABC transporter substrate-binding protein [Specibacter cremeus]